MSDLSFMLHHHSAWIMPTRDTMDAYRRYWSVKHGAWPRLAALQHAQVVMDELERNCERVEIAGSLRRQVPVVKDIEICAIARHDENGHSLLDKWARQTGAVQWIKTGTSEIIPRAPRPGARQLRGVLPIGIKLDLFITTRERWGATFLIRTGSASYSKGVVTLAKKLGCRFEGGEFWVHGASTPVPEEEDIYRLLRLQFVPPDKRDRFIEERSFGTERRAS
jgi:DNA polymerase (family 10)